MSFAPAARLKRFLRSPWTITAELLGIALAGFATTLVDQHPTERVRQLLVEDHPTLARAVRVFGLDRVFTAPWFLALVALAAGSLAVVCWEQWTRLFREWKVPGEAWFRSAPYRTAITRPPTGQGRRVEISIRGRIGALGSPFFHLGLLVCAVAGVGRMLVTADASREIWEGGTIATGAAAFETQDLGPLARPVALPEPVRFLELRPRYYPAGGLLELDAKVQLGEGRGNPVAIAVNQPLDFGVTRLYLSQSFGPAMVVSLPGAAGPEVAVMMLSAGPSGDYEWAGRVPGGPEVRLRAPMVQGAARPPEVLEVRVMEKDALLAVGRLGPGGALDLPRGGAIVLREVRWWVRVLASRDPTAWPMFAGFAIAIVGVILMFGVVRVDTLVVAEPDGDGERVTVAMRPQRLAPVFADRFARRVEREAARR
jgi:cytochrome c biogenesis protein ResB